VSVKTNSAYLEFSARLCDTSASSAVKSFQFWY